MSFMDKCKGAMQRFMTGRRGPDEFSLALLFGGMILSILSGFFLGPVLSLLSMAAFFYSLFRILSRNVEKRYQENVVFVRRWKSVSGKCSQFLARVRNMKKYKYFHCPECNALIRLPRKVGEVTVTCGKCKHQFKQKA